MLTKADSSPKTKSRLAEAEKAAGPEAAPELLGVAPSTSAGPHVVAPGQLWRAVVGLGSRRVRSRGCGQEGCGLVGIQSGGTRIGKDGREDTVK